MREPSIGELPGLPPPPEIVERALEGLSQIASEQLGFSKPAEGGLSVERAVSLLREATRCLHSISASAPTGRTSFASSTGTVRLAES